MGRNRLFDVGEVVTYQGRPCVVVDYRQDSRKRGSYRLVRLLFLPAGRGYGPAVWVESQKIRQNNWGERRPSAVRIARANAKLGDDRGCSCECCPHIAIPLGVIRADGTLEGDDVGTVPGGQEGTDGPSPDPSGGQVP